MKKKKVNPQQVTLLNAGKINRNLSRSPRKTKIKTRQKTSRRNIPKREKAEKYSQQQNRLFDNMIVEAFTFPVYVIDARKGEIIIANSAAKACDINEGGKCSRIKYGLLLTGKLAKKNSLTKENSPAKENPLAKVKKTKKPVRMEFTVFDTEGNNVCREVQSYPIFDARGNLIQIIEYITDITSRKKAQEELVKLSQAVEQSFNIVMITDKNGVIEYVNPKFTEITGYTLHEVIGKSVGFLGEKTHEEEKRFSEILRQQGKWRGEFHARKKNGEYYWEYASIYSIKNLQGDITHYIKDAVNISKRMQAEEELKAAKEKAEQANRFKSEFLANMSHEIRTPLNNILGFIELLLLTELNKTQKDYFDTIKDSSKVLLGIIDDILDFSKIENGKLDVDNIKFYLKHELESVVDMFSVRADEKNIELMYFVDPSLPEYVFGDPLRIKQVLNNLISNAIKFTNETGKIFVEIKLLDITGDYCRILFSISDNGIGIPDDKKDKIFDAFFQADSAITREYGGTGLGLAISSQLVKLMGGELRLESQAGIGSKFYFELTFTEFSGVDIFKRDYSFKNLKSFLYVKDKDDRLQLSNIEKYLKAFNIEVENFSTAEEFGELPLDLHNIIFIDYSSNSRDEIKSILQALPDIPVILIVSRLDKGFNAPIAGKITKVIYKPIYASKIIGAIIDILYNNKEQTANAEKNDEEVRRASFSADALVAEDNAINQKLITLMLKEIGVEAFIVSNGLEVINNFEKKRFDVILMDVNMPVMDGIEATAKILGIEKIKGMKHTPIVALTARTIRGDREILINSGMDDYISKPISINKLYSTLYPFLKNSQNSVRNNNKHSESCNAKALYDLNGTANELGVDIEFLKNLVEQFILNFEDYFIIISRSVKEMDFDTICFEAHKLKGTASNLRLKELAAHFSEIETNARKRNKINYKELLDVISNEFKLLKENFSKDLLK